MIIRQKKEIRFVTNRLILEIIVIKIAYEIPQDTGNW
jgi:hypothetical protein